jgi:hypothetical protein
VGLYEGRDPIWTIVTEATWCGPLEAGSRHTRAPNRSEALRSNRLNDVDRLRLRWRRWPASGYRATELLTCAKRGGPPAAYAWTLSQGP